MEDLSKARNLSCTEIEKLKEEAKQASEAMDEARRKIVEQENSAQEKPKK